VSEQRTLQQNKALHLWLRQVSEALNDAGFSVMMTLKHDAEIPWTPERAKELLWRPVQEAMTGNESTADQNKLAYSDIEQVIARHLGQKLGVTLPPFPSEEGRDAA
jgi:hypothetical protein